MIVILDMIRICFVGGRASIDDQSLELYEKKDVDDKLGKTLFDFKMVPCYG
jgi:hypothetical protein